MTKRQGKTAGLKFYSTALVASDRFLAERPDVARRFIEAFAKAIDFTWKSPEASGVAINKQVPEVDAQVAADTIKAIKGLVYNEASASHGLGKFGGFRRLADKKRGIAIEIAFR